MCTRLLLQKHRKKQLSDLLQEIALLRLVHILELPNLQRTHLVEHQGKWICSKGFGAAQEKISNDRDDRFNVVILQPV